MGTLGGNLCQDVRCWFYRASPFIGERYECLRKGGDRGYALSMENQYHSVLILRGGRKPRQKSLRKI